jgi:TfoX/Sxy family transcriptional regulator of competence genes
MATDREFVEFLTDQLHSECEASARAMFGEYALYSKGKVVALVCNNQLFVKQTEAGRAYIGNCVEAPAYPGARMSFLIEDRVEDGAWLSELILITEKELPKPKPKPKKKAKKK